MNCWTLQMLSWKRMFKLQLWEQFLMSRCSFLGVVSMIWSNFIATSRTDQGLGPSSLVAVWFREKGPLISGIIWPDQWFNVVRCFNQPRIHQFAKWSPRQSEKNPSHQTKINQGRETRRKERTRWLVMDLGHIFGLSKKYSRKLVK